MADVLNFLVARERKDEMCTVDTCPIEWSIYGYAPSIGATVTFVALFVVFAIGHAIVGWRYKTWGFMAAMSIGCVAEAAGYGGRYMLHVDPFSDPGFKLQICLLTFAPAFLAAGIYLMLKRLVLTFGEQFSRLKPTWYTYIFITCDVFSLILQGAGGGMASGAESGSSLMDAGNNTMIAGLVFQVLTLAVFGLLSAEYFFRVWKNRGSLNPETYGLRHSMKFRGFLGALFTAWLTIFIRCVYRVIEMAGGWGNDIMQDEPTFIVLDSLMCVVASGAILVFHPGFCFNWRSFNKSENHEKSISSDQVSAVQPMQV